MNFLSNMRISHKISALMAGLVLGFITIGVTYYVQINIDRGLRLEEQSALSFQSKLAESSLINLQLQSASNQTLNLSDKKALPEYTRLLEKLTSSLEELRPDAKKHNMEGDINNIVQSLSKNLATFSLASNEMETFGFSPREGLKGKIFESLESLREVLQRNQAEAALAFLSTMQTSLDDYLSTREDSFITVIGSQFEQLQKLITSAKMPAREQRLAVTHLDEITQFYSQATESAKIITDALAKMSGQETQINDAFATLQNATRELAESIIEDATEKSRFIQVAVVSIIFLVAMGTAVGVYLIYKSIIFPMAHMQNVIRKINRGKTNARVKLIQNDELGDLGKAFNQLFNERIQQLEEQSLENERLNNSIISLIRALGMIAKKDLTIKVPVSPDITGTISDAVNLLTSETAKTLHQVRDISHEVNEVSGKLQDQSGVVTQFAENERRQIIAISKALDVLARAMNGIASNSEQANKSAVQAIDHTQSAKETVERTVSGIRAIRETISETEKRMKRLGDRSQEISGIVNLINTIAERTHILALNASMHAASAGEAGKGFAVVADEVQRLAESARESTDEIASMVNNIRVETSDTVNIMNTLISQVADGSKLAEKAGEQMSDTENATMQLVETVQTIANQAVEQASVASRVRDRATIIRNFTEKTAKQLAQQQSFTESLKNCADTLVERVNVFELPEQAAPADKTQLKSVS